MWRQKSEEAPVPGHIPAPDPIRPVVTRHPEPPAPSRPVAVPSNHGSLGKGITVRGEISGTDSLFVDGTVEGSICIAGERVTVGRDGRVIAPQGSRSEPCIRAREIVLLGTVVGNIEAEDRVEMRAQASLTGDVVTRRVSIEDGAYFRGGIDIRRDEAPAAAPVSAPADRAEQAELPVHA